ncbi:MAG: YdcF family protein [Alphaproteobacteria bacterium]|nr:YdcF family protein [Alphaproteobacteria bacterium]
MAQDGAAPAAGVGTGVAAPEWIIVFGAGVLAGGAPSPALAARIGAAAAFARARPAARLIVTGGLGRHPPAEAVVMQRGLIAAGIAAARIRTEPTARDTLESALRVREMLAAQAPPACVYALSSAYHVPRCRLLLRLAGLPARAAPAPANEAARVGRWRWLYMHLRELPALPYDALLMLWHRRRWR